MIVNETWRNALATKTRRQTRGGHEEPWRTVVGVGATQELAVITRRDSTTSARTVSMAMFVVVRRVQSQGKCRGNTKEILALDRTSGV